MAKGKKKAELFRRGPLWSADTAATAWYLHQMFPEISQEEYKECLDATELLGDRPFTEEDFMKAIEEIRFRQVDRTMVRSADLGFLMRVGAGADGQMAYRLAREWYTGDPTKEGEAAHGRATAAIAKILDADGPIGCEQRATAELIRLRLFEELEKDAPPQGPCPTCEARH